MGSEPEVAARPNGERSRASVAFGGYALLVAIPALVAALVVWLHLGGVGLPAGGGAPGGVSEVRAAHFVPGAIAPAAPATPLQLLPHDWSATDREAREGSYFVEFARSEVPEPGAALYLPGVNTRATIRVNGNLVGAVEEEPGLASRHWRVPLYRSIPSALLVSGNNRVEIRLHVDSPGTGFLSQFYLGPESLLRPAFELRHFLQVSSIQILVIAMWSFGLFTALLSLLRRKDTSYFWFAVVMWVFGFGFWNLLAIDARIPKPPYIWVGAVTMAWLVIAMLIFVHRFLGERRPRMELALASAAALGSLWFWVVQGTELHSATIPFWGAAVLALGVYPAARVVLRFRTAPSPELALTIAVCILVFAAGAHDIAMVNGRLAPTHDFAIQHAAWASVAIFAFVFVKRFIDALDTSEALSEELGERVAQKAEELEAGYRRLRSLEREQAVARERERILGEIHDGMGGQLVSALAMVRNGEGDSGETADAIQSALDDMRLMIHSLDDVEADVGTLLGSLRSRIGRRLEAAGLELVWQVSDTPAPANFGQDSALQVLRIAQEAITNVLKHASARSLVVRTRVAGEGAQERVLVEIEDDGQGFDARSSGQGRGLANMRSRAERIGGVLELHSTAAGSCVRLALQTERAAALAAPAIAEEPAARSS